MSAQVTIRSFVLGAQEQQEGSLWVQTVQALETLLGAVSPASSAQQEEHQQQLPEPLSALASHLASLSDSLDSLAPLLRAPVREEHALFRAGEERIRFGWCSTALVPTLQAPITDASMSALHLRGFLLILYKLCTGKHARKLINPGWCFRQRTLRKNGAALLCKMEVLSKLLAGYATHRTEDCSVVDLEDVTVLSLAGGSDGGARDRSSAADVLPVLYSRMSEEWERVVDDYQVDARPFFRNFGDHLVFGNRFLFRMLVSLNATADRLVHTHSDCVRLCAIGCFLGWYCCCRRGKSVERAYHFYRRKDNFAQKKLVWDTYDNSIVRCWETCTHPRVNSSRHLDIPLIGAAAGGLEMASREEGPGAPVLGHVGARVVSDVINIRVSRDPTQHHRHAKTVLEHSSCCCCCNPCIAYCGCCMSTCCSSPVPPSLVKFGAGGTHPQSYGSQLVSGDSSSPPAHEEGVPSRHSPVASSSPTGSSAGAKASARGAAAASESTSMLSGQGMSSSNTLILHFHGGGFVSMTAQAHESYLRVWSQTSGCTVVSVDYSKAPESPFPEGLHQCFDAYVWACGQMESPDTPFSHVVLAGDSAGGNFVLGVVQLAIHHGLPLPDGAILMYPATLLQNLSSPARLMAFFDPMVNISFLNMVQQHYSGGNHATLAESPLGSPGIMSDQVLAQFPPVYVSVGATDPLLDDSILICQRLAKLGREVSLNVWDGLAHGYCNLSKISKQAKAAARHAASWVVERFLQQ